MKPIPLEQIKDMIEKQVIRHELLGEAGDEARKLVTRSAKKQKKVVAKKAAAKKNKNDSSKTQEAVNREPVKESDSTGDVTKPV